MKNGKLEAGDRVNEGTCHSPSHWLIRSTDLAMFIDTNGVEHPSDYSASTLQKRFDLHLNWLCDINSKRIETPKGEEDVFKEFPRPWKLIGPAFYDASEKLIDLHRAARELLLAAVNAFEPGKADEIAELQRKCDLMEERANATCASVNKAVSLLRRADENENLSLAYDALLVLCDGEGPQPQAPPPLPGLAAIRGKLEIIFGAYDKETLCSIVARDAIALLDALGKAEAGALTPLDQVTTRLPTMGEMDEIRARDGEQVRPIKAIIADLSKPGSLDEIGQNRNAVIDLARHVARLNAEVAEMKKGAK